MIIPLFVEQFLLLLVGIADTFVVSFVGDSAVSGVSLVNSFNTVIIFLFSALASGGAVIISQYIGSRRAGGQGGKSAVDVFDRQLRLCVRAHTDFYPPSPQSAFRQGGGRCYGGMRRVYVHNRVLLPGARGL